MTAVIVLPAYTLFYLSPAFSQLMTDNTEQAAVEVANHLTTMVIPAAGDLTADFLKADFASYDEKIRHEFNLIKIKVFSRAGEVIHSSSPEDIGALNRHVYFMDVVAKGGIYTKTVQKDARSLENQVMKVDVVETYVPIMRGDEFIGAFEIYFDITSEKERLDNLVSRINVTMITIALGLLLAVIISSYKAGKSISDQQRAEKALESNEARFRELFNNMGAGVAVFEARDAGDDFVFIDINRSAERIDTLDRAAVLGRSILEVMPGIREFGFFDLLKRVYESGESEHYPIAIYQDDKVEGWRENYVFRLPSGEVVAIYDDLTKDKRSKQELYDSMEKLRKSLAGTIQAMALTVETRDSYTSGHQKRAADLARAIARELSLSKDQVDAIRMAGVVHDLGKLSVPAETLSKPGKLTDLEFALIKVHPQVGYDILKGIDFPWPIAQIVLQHHERLDGSGYPNGLKGHEISMVARVLAVADVVEAMSSHRPYRPALSLVDVLAEIQGNRGILYDPNVVDASVRLLVEERFKFADPAPDTSRYDDRNEE